jgi:hypothetical protein
LPDERQGALEQPASDRFFEQHDAPKRRLHLVDVLGDSR